MSPDAISRRVKTHAWIRMCEGTYRLAAFPTGMEQLLIAGCLWAGPDSFVSHRSAAALWRLDGVALEVAEITDAGHRRSPMPGLVVHRADDVRDSDRGRLGPFVVASVARTLIDLGRVLPLEDVEIALDSALRRRLTTIGRLTARLDLSGTRGRKGAATLARLLAERPAGNANESALETRFWRLLRSGLPLPERQYEIRSDGRLLARVDFAYPARRLAIEVDGYEFHHGRARWQRDLERRSTLALLGWRVMHVTAADFVDPDSVISRVGAALKTEVVAVGRAGRDSARQRRAQATGVAGSRGSDGGAAAARRRDGSRVATASTAATGTAAAR